MNDLSSYTTVQTWMRSAHFEIEDPRITLLAGFCELVQRNPDEMISECLSIVQAGQFKLRGKTRRGYVEQIEAFEIEHGGRVQGNIIRSFFIHNGIPIQPPILL